MGEATFRRSLPQPQPPQVLGAPRGRAANTMVGRRMRMLLTAAEAPPTSHHRTVPLKVTTLTMPLPRLLTAVTGHSHRLTLMPLQQLEESWAV